MTVYRVRVGFTVSRPVVPDEMISFVTIAAGSETEASLFAALMVGITGACVFGCHACEMVTSTTIL